MNLWIEHKCNDFFREPSGRAPKSSQKTLFYVLLPFFPEIVPEFFPLPLPAFLCLETAYACYILKNLQCSLPCNAKITHRRLSAPFPTITPHIPVTKNVKQNAGTSWTNEEDDVLRNEFQSGMKIAEIAKAHGRTNGAIRARLKKHGLLE